MQGAFYSSLTCLQPVSSDKADCADIYQLKNVAVIYLSNNSDHCMNEKKTEDVEERRKFERRPWLLSLEGAEPPGRHTLRDAGGSN